MSFLNPVNEPVLRFKSTDAGAPQIDYNARVAGDIKAVIKACLVTGYGTKASAGWSVVNEVGNIAEFVSPSTAMSDYRLGIDDSTTTKITWYYTYQGSRTNPDFNEPSKAFSFIDKTSTNNGWQLFVTDRGLFFIELLQHSAAQKLVARITWWGQVKSALADSTGINISYFNTGYNANSGTPQNLFNIGSNANLFRHIRLATYSRCDFNACNIAPFYLPTRTFGESVMDSVSEVFLSFDSTMLGQQVGFLLRDVNLQTDVLGVNTLDVDGRPVVFFASAEQQSAASNAIARTKVLGIRSDYWGF